jgi:hypothetical protein
MARVGRGDAVMTNTHHDDPLAWLVAGDPAITWQAMRDLLDLPAAVWRAERARVETEGWGARLLALQDGDGQWAGGAFLPAGFTRLHWEREGQPWTATCFVLHQLREFGLDPASAAARRAVSMIGANSRWDHEGEPYWEGEVEECINGRTLADGAYFGADVSRVLDRLLADRQPDGGWNCERRRGSQCSSFATTLNVLEGLLEHEKAHGPRTRVREARHSGEEYLLRRHLFESLRSGAPADPEFLCLYHPNRWRYDVLRALDYFRESSRHDARPVDSRLTKAVELVRSKRRPDGTWALERELPGRIWFEINDGPGKPSRWLTLRALRVLRWWDAADSPARRRHLRPVFSGVEQTRAQHDL